MERDPDRELTVDPAQDPRTAARTIKTVVAPRPIGWISTVDAEGTDNLAPYSYFNAISNDPPTVMFVASRPDGREKDTPRNAIDTGEFVVNLVTEDLIEEMDRTSKSTSESEFDVANLERAPSETVAPPRVKAAGANMECEVVETLQIGGNTVVFGQSTFMHVKESLLADGKIDSRKIDSIGRLGGPYYSRADPLDFTRQY